MSCGFEKTYEEKITQVVGNAGGGGEQGACVAKKKGGLHSTRRCSRLVDKQRKRKVNFRRKIGGGKKTRWGARPSGKRTMLER